MVLDSSVPMVWFRLVVPFGAGVEPEGKEGLANVTAELLLRGTLERSRDVFERTLEGLGASIGAYVGVDSITLSGSVLSENWPKLATLLAEALNAPAFAQQDLVQLVQETKAEIIESRNDDRSLGRDFLAQGLYGEHPYGRSVSGTSSSLDRITRDDVVAFHSNWFASRGAILALLGHFDAGAGSDLARVAGQLRGSPPELPLRPELQAPQGRKLWLVNKPGRTQVQIHLAHLFPKPEGPDFAAAWVANEAFGGYGFSARLMQEVREKRGWSYGAYGAFHHARDTSSYTLWVFPATADALSCMELVLELYERFAAEGITEEELVHARNAITNSAAFFVDTPAKRLSYEVRKRMTGYDPLAVLPHVAEVTRETASTAAATFFHPGDFFGTVVGTADAELATGEGEKTATLRSALEGLFGAPALEVVPYDREGR